MYVGKRLNLAMQRKLFFLFTRLIVLHALFTSAPAYLLNP